MGERTSFRTLEAMIGNKYRVIREIGRGGMGAVLEAENTATGSLVALKIVHGDDPTHAVRLVREARACAMLRSRFVVRVLDVDRSEDGSPFVVMERLRGRSLGDELRAGRTFRWTEAAAFVIQACAALSEAHAAGFVHRDVKPANLFISDESGGIIKVLDFGVAKSHSADTLTSTGDLLGTPPYMAPEQLRSDELDGRADIWALGVVLYRLASGRMPFGENTAEAIARALAPSPAPRLEGDEAFADVVARALEKDPAQRIPTAAQLAFDLASTLPSRSRQVEEALDELSVSDTKPAPPASRDGVRLATHPFPPGKSPFRAKGTAFTGVFAAHDRLVDGGFARVVASLDPDLREFCSQPFLAASMYDVLPLVPISVRGAQLAKTPFRDHVRTIGEMQVERDRSGVYKNLLGGSSAEEVLAKIPRLFSQYFDFGSIDAKVTSPTTFEGATRGLPAPFAPWYLLCGEGMMSALLAAVGATNMRLIRRPLVAEEEVQGVRLLTSRFVMRWELATSNR
jgi:serine/threonine protein kinase